MTLTVLSDHQVQTILEGLTSDQLDEFSQVLSSALHQYSTNSQPGPNGPYQQPRRIKTHHNDTHATSLYMPSCGPEGMGCKTISFTMGPGADGSTKPPDTAPIAPVGVLNLFSPTGQPTGLVHAKTLTAFRTALASVCLVRRRRRCERILVFGAGTQAYWHVRLALMARGHSVRKVYVSNRAFAGAAALVRRLASVPEEAKRREGWGAAEFAVLTPAFHDFDRLLAEYVLGADVIYCCTPSRENLFDGELLTSHEGRRRGRLIIAVGSLTPDMRELPHELLAQATKRRDPNAHHHHFHKHADHGGVVVVDSLDGALHEAGEIVAGNIQPSQLIELGELVMLRQLEAQESESDQETPASETPDDDASGRKSSSAMSSVYGATQSSSSSRASSPSRQHARTPSLTSRLPFRKASSSSTVATTASTSSAPAKGRHHHHVHANTRGKSGKDETGLCKWLMDGTVIYKSVGLGMMDLVVGNHLMKLAEEQHIGTRIPDF